MDPQQPPSPQENPYLPPGPPPLVFDTFIGIDTASSRPGINDEAMAWCDGFIPLGKNNLRVLPDVGPKLYDSGNPTGIVYYAFANLGNTPICVVFLSNGSVQQVNTDSGVVMQIAPAGTILNPARGALGVSQWGSQYILFVAQQTNGYFAWDGAALYTAGTIAPLITVTDSGQNYTSTPTVTASGGSGSGATFTVDIENESVANIYTKTPGSGYQSGDTIILTITGGGSDSTASATANISANGGIQAVNVNGPGAQYGAGSYVTASGGGGSGAVLIGEFQGGQCVSVTVLNPGHDFTSPPSISIFDPTHDGFGFSATAVLGFGQISSIAVSNGGSGYTTPPTVNIIGDGSGCVLQAVVSGGAVTSVKVINHGFGYTKAQVEFTGGNNAATATGTTMPFGVKGSELETYQSRPWIVDGSKLIYAAPESLSDFATSDGGGVVESVDSFLRVAYSRPIQTNGFLYLIADSSINYISGVATAGTPPTTTFTNQNADPEIGTPYPDTIDVFSRNILFANSFGVHVSYGGAVAKVSEALDGVFNTVPNFGGFIPSAGKAIIFGKKIWMVLLPVIDPITGGQVNKLLMWNGKNWFSSQQGINLTFINSQEINSVLTTYGTDGQSIYPLFQSPSTNFTKTAQSKLWATPGGYFGTKTATRFCGLAYYYSRDGGNLQVSIDNETASSAIYDIAGVPQTVSWVNDANAPVTWENVSSTVVQWGSGGGVGVFVIEPIAVAQTGALIGNTITTDAADMALISLTTFTDFFGHRL